MPSFDIAENKPSSSWQKQPSVVAICFLQSLVRIDSKDLALTE
jgi:hypothetical protein